MSETPKPPAHHTIDEPGEPYVRMNVTREDELERESHDSLYLKVWAGLAVFTAVEYFYAHIFKDLFFFLVLGLLAWAVIKGKWVYGMLIPAGILACILTAGLYPDIAMQPVTEESLVEEENVTPNEESERPPLPSPVPKKGELPENVFSSRGEGQAAGKTGVPKQGELPENVFTP